MKKLLRKIVDKLAFIKNKKKVTLKGTGQKFYRSTQISLSDSSKKEDIIIGSNARIHGKVVSANNGKIYIGKYAQVGPNSKLYSVNNIYIGDYTAIAQNVIISDNNNHPINPYDRIKLRITPEGSELRKWKHSDNKPIYIGENVWIGENSRILKGVTIGENSVVAANTVVTKDVPANAIVAGNPGKIVKTEIDKLPRKFKN